MFIIVHLRIPHIVLFLILCLRFAFIIEELENNLSYRQFILYFRPQSLCCIDICKNLFGSYVAHSYCYFCCHIFFPKCLLIHQFNLLYICVFSSEYCNFGWLCITSKIFEGNYLLCCVSFCNSFHPRQFCHYFNCRSFCSFFISSSNMCAACYSDGFFLKEFGLCFSHEGLLLCGYKHTRKTQIFLAYDFCYHSAFQQVGFCFFFRVVFLHAVARAQAIQFSSPICFPRYCYINNTIVLL